ncbi:MAG TPA: phosphoglycerate dehydrogenase [Planctomycetota bacterium]|nr:phosphoglycerate dehydrogenase [Planctomycetota bacterium]HRR82107.1 phosphoglycerate dehydrogenase [Planctomycetota bacterium]
MRVVVSDPLSPEGIAILKQAGHEVIEVAPTPPEPLREALAEADALLVRSGTKVTAELLEAAPRLKVIGRAGAGVDNVDLDAATRRGIVVMNTPGGNTVAACELTMAMMLALARRLPQLSARVKAGEWPKKGAMGTELQGKRLGIIGLGRIGSEVARRALAFGMEVVAHDPFVSEERARSLEVRLVSLDELLATSDVITVHAPRTGDTSRLLDAAAFARMKKGVLLINCARGGIIAEADLAEALRSGQVGGCALDVFDKEPPGDSPLLAFDQVIATPHVGATTREAQASVATQIAHQVAAFLRGEAPRNAVNVPCFEPELLETLGPYVDLAGRLGSLVVQLAEGGINRLTVTYRGEMNDHDVRPLTTALLKGLLRRAVPTVNDVNAPVIATERGIKVDVVKSGALEDFANLISVDAWAGDRATSVAGSLLARHTPRIVRIDNYRVDAAPAGHLLVTRNHDRPGVIAHVSSVLAHRNVNIADMTCGRDYPGGTSMLVISIDSPLSAEILREIEASPLILRAQLVSL